MFKVELINTTNYANIYGIYTKAGQAIGTAEVKLAGREAGKTFFYTLTGKYSRADIRKIYTANK